MVKDGEGVDLLAVSSLVVWTSWWWCKADTQALLGLVLECPWPGEQHSKCRIPRLPTCSVFVKASGNKRPRSLPFLIPRSIIGAYEDQKRNISA